MTNPQVAIFMLSLFIVLVLFGFPIALTLLAMGVGFGVLLVPSRERVVASWSMRSGSATRSVLGGLVASQDALAGDYATFFEREGIPYVDALAEVLAAFSEAVAEGRDFYPPDDGHPVASGYAAYAQAAARLVALTQGGR